MTTLSSGCFSSLYKIAYFFFNNYHLNSVREVAARRIYGVEEGHGNKNEVRII